jgi:hypothetical protein
MFIKYVIIPPRIKKTSAYPVKFSAKLPFMLKMPPISPKKAGLKSAREGASVRDRSDIDHYGPFKFCCLVKRQRSSFKAYKTLRTARTI